MLYLTHALLFPWLLAALALGAFVGWRACQAGPQTTGSGGLAGVLVVFALALLAAATLAVPGRLGLWIDSSLHFAGWYLAGCCLGCFFGGAVLLKPDAAGRSAASPSPIPAWVVPTPSDPAAPAAAGSEPAPAPALAGEDEFAGQRPPGLAAPRGGAGDDLKRIRGIGRTNEGRLHGLGIWHFDQVAAWTADHALWIGGYLAFPGRIEREGWIAQAKLLATGADTDFSRRVAKGLVSTSKEDGPPAATPKD